MTSATSPSLEDIVTGTIPGLPKVVIHNQVLAFKTGEEYAGRADEPERASVGVAKTGMGWCSV